MADPAIIARKQARAMKDMTEMIDKLSSAVEQLVARQPTPLDAELIAAEGVVTPALSDEQLAQVAGVVKAELAPIAQALADLAQRLPSPTKGGK